MMNSHRTASSSIVSDSGVNINIDTKAKHTRKQQKSAPTSGPASAGSEVSAQSTRSTINYDMQQSASKPAESSSVLSVSVQSQKAADVPDMVVCELLAYITHYRNKSNIEALRRTVLSFYSPVDICQAKKVLVARFSSQIGSSSMVAERRNSSTRAAHEAEFDDIIALFDTLDLQNVLCSCIFVASDLDHLPKFGPEEINIASVVEKQLRTEATIKDLSSAIEQLAANRVTTNVTDAALIEDTAHQLTGLQVKLESFSSSVFSRLDHLDAVCGCGVGATKVTQQPTTSADVYDRRNNIVIFGIKEHQNASVWHVKVKEILHCVTGRQVDVVDIFRLGRYNAASSNGLTNQSKPRPVLIKLRAVWDKRIILSQSYKLKQDHRGIFIVADESPEMRRKSTLERLRYRAERAGKVVAVSDGVLSIDGTVVFSLLDGFIDVTHG